MAPTGSTMPIDELVLAADDEHVLGLFVLVGHDLARFASTLVMNGFSRSTERSLLTDFSRRAPAAASGPAIGVDEQHEQPDDDDHIVVGRDRGQDQDEVGESRSPATG